MSTRLERWVAECAALTQPDRVVWCDGSQAEADRLIDVMLADGTLSRLNPATHPNCYLHRSDHRDVARTEKVTFTCTSRREDAGPTNNWMSPADARDKVGPLFAGAMRGRTMYVVPYLMGPVGSPFARVGVEITDSPYVVLSMRVMTRMGRVALDRLGSSDDFVPGLHSLGDLSPDRRYILHFLEEGLIWSVGSGYGGNALLGKKCFALRMAGWMARREGWMAEHMLILGLTDPSGETTYIAAAFPSACGKTNLAMLVSPLESAGYRVTTVGDDIAWMRPGPDGRLWAVNPEAGFFGVAPGTSAKTNPNAMATIAADTIYTNVAVTPDGRPWWEGIGGPDGETPPGLTDWRGRPHDRHLDEPAAHPNSRFTAPARRCPSISPKWEDPQGVPISAILFGGRRARLAPLVYQARSWAHGVLVGATMASETTAAATGEVGVVRRDPMAMLPFCAYHLGDYFGHWLSMGERLTRPPAVFHVNWFRKDTEGRYLWPGYGQNIRVLMWVLDRLRGRGDAVETPIGHVPTPASLPLDGLGLSPSAVGELLRVDADEWASALPPKREFLDRLGDRLPPALRDEMDALERRVTAVRG
jgi:phosphoenolpyruvate carboxykinase (GTP)